MALPLGTILHQVRGGDATPRPSHAPVRGEGEGDASPWPNPAAGEGEGGQGQAATHPSHPVRELRQRCRLRPILPTSEVSTADPPLPPPPPPSRARQAARQVPSWREVIGQVTPGVQHFTSAFLRPMAFSPWQ